jgi:protein-S-isoprenylcysteine O-methyltransferase Ste14
MRKRDRVLGVVLAISAVGQVILALVLHSIDGLDWLENAGWTVLLVSAVLGWLPIWTLQRRGGVQKGDSYTETTQLVDSGLYSIARHPQYLAGALVGLALTMITPHWLVATLGAISAAMFCVIATHEERSCIGKLGDVYMEYMERVPPMNIVLGTIRLVVKRRQGEGP